MLYHLYTDGGARGNPGPAGAGVVIKDSAGRILDEFSAYLGPLTNNQAEYQALLLGLGRVGALSPNKAKTQIQVHLDSELLVRQLSGQYRVKSKSLKILYEKVKKMEQEFQKLSYAHRPRAENSLADKLVNRAIDEAGSSSRLTWRRRQDSNL